MKILKKQFNSDLKKYFLFENNPTIAVAVSGGPDSLALACKAVAGGDGAYVIELGKNLKKALFGD